MKAYKTYKEAKIANPQCDIYHYLCGGLDDVFTTMSHRAGVVANTKCNPADHCSTLAEFLAAGYLLACMDKTLNLHHGKKVDVITKIHIKDGYNDVGDTANNNIYILSAAAIGGASKIPEVSKVKEIDWSKMPEGATGYYFPAKGVTGWKKQIESTNGICSYFWDVDEWVRGAVVSHEVFPIPTLRIEYVKAESAERGNELYVGSSKSSVLVVGWHPEHPVVVLVDNESNYFAFPLDDLYRKTLVPVDEVEEAAKCIHDVANKAFFTDMPERWQWEFADDKTKGMWRAVAELTGFRKPE